MSLVSFMKMDFRDAVHHATLNFKEICRMCLKKVSNMTPIFTVPIPTKIMSLVSIEIFEGDGLPALICPQCCQEVDRFHKFQMLCKSSDATLRQYILRNIPTSRPSPGPVSSECNRQFIKRSKPKVLSHQPEESSHAEDLSEDRTILPHQRQESTMKNENIVMPKPIICNVTTRDGKTTIVTVQRPRNVSQLLNKEPVAQTNTVKRKFIPSLPKVIKIMRPKPDPVVATREPISFKCNVCSKSFPKRDKLKNHEIMHTGEKPFLCEECGKSFARKPELDLHMRYHSGVRPYSCTMCDKTYISVSALKIHENWHNGIKPFLCNICGKAFFRKSGLVHHERIHLQEKPYSCNVCGKTFTTTSNLTTHAKRHSGVDEFCCRTCKKTFFTKSGLERHELVHSGLKQFPCEVCSSSFFTKTEVTRHMRYHKGVKRFNCDQCYRSFMESHHLTVHKRIHTGERPYLCKLCKKSFYTKSKLNRHMQTHGK